MTYTFDVFSTLDGYGSYTSDGDWGGYWGKQGPEFLERRLDLYREQPRLVLGANTFRQFAAALRGVSDPVNTTMRNLPTTVVSTTLRDTEDWPDATLEPGDAVEVVARLKETGVPLRSHGSLSMNRALMAAGLVDRVQVTIFPVISAGPARTRSSQARRTSTWNCWRAAFSTATRRNSPTGRSCTPERTVHPSIEYWAFSGQCASLLACPENAQSRVRWLRRSAGCCDAGCR